MLPTRTRVHINLEVADLARSVAFYTAFFGRVPSKQHPDYANWRLEAPALHLALVAKPGFVRPPGDAHHGIELFDPAELAALGTRLEQAGLALDREEQVTCCYAVADKLWAKDPDGNAWELWVRSDDAASLHGEADERVAGEGVARDRATSASLAEPGAEAMPLVTLQAPAGADDAPC